MDLARPRYTVFIRLPFPREDFRDPPQVQWDASRDQQLWKYISKASQSKALNWEQLSSKFNVPLPFLLQQAAWLYERHFEGVKAQMKGLGTAGVAASGLSGSTPSGDGHLGGSDHPQLGADGVKLPPAINTLRRSPLTSIDAPESPSTPKAGKPGMSRSPSSNTVTQSRVFSTSRPSSSRQSGTPFKQTTPSRTSDDSHRAGARLSPSNDASSPLGPDSRWTIGRKEALASPRFNASSESGRFSSDADAENDEDDDSSDGSLPFASSAKPTKSDLTATLRSAPKKQPPPSNSKNKEPILASPSSESSQSSTQQIPSKQNVNEVTAQRSGPRGPLSPKQQADLDRLSPRYKKSGSEASPSIGSSFSDLDDASITQSALDEALLSNMQHGSGGTSQASRTSTLNDVFGRR